MNLRTVTELHALQNKGNCNQLQKIKKKKHLQLFMKMLTIQRGWIGLCDPGTQNQSYVAGVYL